jgi:hypothetical protein
MASLTNGNCTCETAWRGKSPRPECVLHEAQLPPGTARRKDGTLCRVLATVAGRRAARDPEGMGSAAEWYPWP